jgi:hypothetical protein
VFVAEVSEFVGFGIIIEVVDTFPFTSEVKT